MSAANEQDSLPAYPLRRPETSVLVNDALTKDANDADALFVLAALRVQDAHTEEGLAILNRLLALNPEYPGAWFFKEKIHRMRGETAEAESARQRGEALES